MSVVIDSKGEVSASPHVVSPEPEVTERRRAERREVPGTIEQGRQRPSFPIDPTPANGVLDG
jgi:hypothetical protein